MNSQCESQLKACNPVPDVFETGIQLLGQAPLWESYQMFGTSIETLSHELASATSIEIAAPQLEQASLLLLDTIGCAIAGRPDHGLTVVTQRLSLDVYSCLLTRRYRRTLDIQTIQSSHRAEQADFEQQGHQQALFDTLGESNFIYLQRKPRL